MKVWKISLHFYLALFTVFTAWMPACSESATQPKNVFIIILNSIRYSDAFGDKRHLYIDNMWEKMRPYGTVCKNMYNNSVTLPFQAQSALLTGTSNTDTGSTLRSHHPTIFEYYRKQAHAPKENVLFATSDSVFSPVACSNNSEYGSEFAPIILENDSIEADGPVIKKKTIDFIQEKHPSLVVLSFTTGKSIHHHLTEKDCKVLSRQLNDECGTAESLNMYYEGIIMADMMVMKLWEMVQSDEIYKGNTLFIVASSQGRHTVDYTSYGDNCEGCSRLLFFIAGPGIRTNYVSNKKRFLDDIVPTLGKSMGIKTDHATGSIMNEIFSDK
jgi:hypothetical protein